MSIIHNALKKVQEKAPPHRQTEPARPTSIPPAASYIQPLPTEAEIMPGKPSPTLIILGVILSVVVIVILTVLFRLSKEAISRPKGTTPKTVMQTATLEPVPIITAVKNAVAGPTASSSLPPPSMPTLLPNPTPALVPGEIRLEGIMDMGNKKVALINGEVYEEGQVVEGKIIAEISRNVVIVMDNGTKKIIPLKK